MRLTLVLAVAASLVAASSHAGEPDPRFDIRGRDIVLARGDLVAQARRHVGRTARDLGLPRRLWCADFVNLVRRDAGLRPVPSRLAADQALGGRRLTAPVAGAVVVLTRRGGRSAAHTGIVSEVLASGDLMVISGNSTGGRVTERVYPRGRILALVEPN